LFRNILIVCTGNICRSPLAEALLRERTAGKDFQISSAGTGAMVGWPADPPAVEVGQTYGLDLSAHRARQLTQPLLIASELVLTLDQSHSDWINQRYPQFRGRVHKILKWQKNLDVDDPYQRPQAAFIKAYQDIELGISDWLKKLS
jgi:protein-tyrosine phosphatase